MQVLDIILYKVLTEAIPLELEGPGVRFVQFVIQCFTILQTFNKNVEAIEQFNDFKNLGFYF